MAEIIIRTESGDITFNPQWGNLLKFLIVTVLAAGAYFIPLGEGASEAAHMMTSIFVLAAGLWVSEAVPPFATAILVVVLEIYILGRPGGVLEMEASGLTNSWREFINPMASPVILLFFGGFILAAAATKHGLDKRMAKMLLRPFGTKPSTVLLGIILITGTFSMFMSNTATTAMMIAILAPLVHLFEKRDRFRKALVLAVPFAANIGGMGTIIGTPPNAVAAAILREMSTPENPVEISFLKWMMFGVPIAITLMMVLWVILITMYKPRTEKLEVLFPETPMVSPELIIVTGTFVLTVVLWMTSPFHKIPSAVVALIPVGIFTVMGILDAKDLNSRIEWNVLILVGGGLALGVGMQRTGLSAALVGLIPFEVMPMLVLLIAIMVVTLLMSNFMSNTSASNLLIPIIVSITSISSQFGAVAVALAASMAMSLPISTPPNAIAFATKEISTRSMVKTGNAGIVDWPGCCRHGAVPAAEYEFL